MSPAVSVCIPSYNSATYLEETVRAVLAQTFDDLELFIVDDASTDGSADVAERFLVDPRVTLVRNEKNLGPTANWNRALDLTSGEFVKLVCGDDLLYPTAIEQQVAALRAAPDASMAAARRDVIDHQGRRIFRDRGLRGLDGLVQGSSAIRRTVRSGTNLFGEPFCVLLRRSAVDSVGGFRDRHYVIDLDYWTRVLQHGSLVAIPATLGAFRVVPTSWSRRIGRAQAAQSIALFRELCHDLPAELSFADLARGAVAATVQNQARLVLYAMLRQGRA